MPSITDFLKQYYPRGNGLFLPFLVRFCMKVLFPTQVQYPDILGPPPPPPPPHPNLQNPKSPPPPDPAFSRRAKGSLVLARAQRPPHPPPPPPPPSSLSYPALTPKGTRTSGSETDSGMCKLCGYLFNLSFLYPMIPCLSFFFLPAYFHL